MPVAGIATGYGEDGRGVGVRVPVGARFFVFYTSSRPSLGPTYLMGTGGSVSGDKAKLNTSKECPGQEEVDLYIHSLICLHGVVLN
jgi:hypothetical protein